MQARDNRESHLEWERKLSLGKICDKGFGDRPELKQYTKQLSLYKRTQNWQGALKLIYRLEEEGEDPDVIIYNATFSVLNHSCKHRQMLQLFEHMRKVLQQCFDLLKKNIKTFKTLFFSKRGIEPTLITYNLAISAAGSLRQLTQALHLFREAKGLGLSPSIVTYR